jgi:cytochrome c oxidase cbb3-type subunit 3
MNDNRNDNGEETVEAPGHTYDGIHELNHPLPSWWLWSFFFTIIFSFLYYLHYEIAGGPSLKQELSVAMQEIQQNQAHQPVVLETEESLTAAMRGSAVLTLGSTTFAAKCAACHGTNLQGQIGPNLTDKYWIHGKGRRTDIVKVIREGVADKGMPNWGQILSKEEVYAVAAFILSKKNSNPPNPKPPQGEAVEP